MECRINYCWRNNRRTIDCKLMIVGHILLGQDCRTNNCRTNDCRTNDCIKNYIGPLLINGRKNLRPY